MKLKTIFACGASLLLMTASLPFASYAVAGDPLLQTYFSGDGKTIKIFTTETLQDNASLLVGNVEIPAEVKNSGVAVRTTFLIDNSTSMPGSLREPVKEAIRTYAASLPEGESLKIGKFDTETVFLADEYTTDSSYIDYELTQVSFDGQASLVYDAVLQSVGQIDPDQDVYYRTVLFTDGLDSVEGTSFDYLRSVISDNGRYHLDIVQTSKSDKKDVNLSALAELGSNTFQLFHSGDDLASLRPNHVSMLKAALVNEVATGELKGVTIKNGTFDLVLGSILFPQVDIPVPTTEAPVETTEELTEPPTEPPTTEPPPTEPPVPEKEDNGVLMWIILGVIALVILGGGAAALVYLHKRRNGSGGKCVVSVRITKEDERDQKGTGTDEWEFAVGSEFRVGRTTETSGADGGPVQTNHRGICEMATEQDITSIGRNAFALSYDSSHATVLIRNIAKNATFSVEQEGKSYHVKGGQSVALVKGGKILLGNYTTITILDIIKK